LSLENDAVLLRGFRAGVVGAAEELWRVFAPRMLAVARGLLGPQRAHMAPDIVQRVMLDTLRLDVSRVESVRDVGAFLAVSTRHATFNAMRGENREVMRIRAAARRGHMEERQEETPWDAYGDLATALESLSDEHRELIVLRHCAGLSFDELAEALGEARSTLSSRYARAKELLREKLEAMEAERKGGQTEVKADRKTTLKNEAHARGETGATQSRIVGGSR
jgi:RNA polymerase sigma factor (sigma-70 family)